MVTAMHIPLRALRLVALLVLGLDGLGVALAGRNTHLPSSFPRCSLKDPKANECFRRAMQTVIPELVKGVPSLGILSLDPLEILEADIGAPEGPVAISLNFKKLKIRGLHSAKILSLTFNPNSYTISMKAKLSAPLHLDGHYKISGRVLVLPIQGEGQCNLRLDNVVADINIAGHAHTKHDQKYMMVDKLAFSFETSRLNMVFHNLFNGQKEIGMDIVGITTRRTTWWTRRGGDNMNLFLNQNWQEVLGELKPSIHETFGAAFQAIATRIFDKVAFDNIFLP